MPFHPFLEHRSYPSFARQAAPLNRINLISPDKKRAYPVMDKGFKLTRGSILFWTESRLFGFILGLHMLGNISPTGSNELYDTLYPWENPLLGSH